MRSRIGSWLAVAGLLVVSGLTSVLSAPTASAAPAVVVDLVATPTSAQPGQSVSASARVHSASGTVTVQALTIAVRDGSGGQYDFPGAVNNVAVPASGYTYASGARTLPAGTYDAFVAVQIGGVWTDLDPHRTIVVGGPSAGVVVDSLTVPTTATAGQSVGASARVHATGASVAVQAITVAVRGVGDTQADFPGAVSATVPPAGYTFTSGTRTVTASNYEAFVAVQVNGTWYNLDPHKIFTVGAAADPLTFVNEFNSPAGSGPNVGSGGTRGGTFYTDLCWKNADNCNEDKTRIVYDDGHVRQDGSSLVITADTNHGTNSKCGSGACLYGSGRLTMINPATGVPTFQQIGGRWEARMQLPRLAGMWPAFWTVGDPRAGAWPQTGEIDIAEYFGSDLNNVTSYLHYGPSENVEYPVMGTVKPVDVSQWHVYALDWNPAVNGGYLKFSVDNVPFWTVTASDVKANNGDWNRIQTRAQSVILDLAIGAYGGTPPTGAFSQQMKIDYLRVYQDPML